ncbi:hypothetical protein [Vacuolonema iberomarrocanum]|nr:hypothetical protein [filamentous cyanobacterium LEGE 07170]
MNSVDGRSPLLPPDGGCKPISQPSRSYFTHSIKQMQCRNSQDQDAQSIA